MKKTYVFYLFKALVAVFFATHISAVQQQYSSEELIALNSTVAATVTQTMNANGFTSNLARSRTYSVITVNNQIIVQAVRTIREHSQYEALIHFHNTINRIARIITNRLITDSVENIATDLLQYDTLRFSITLAAPLIEYNPNYTPKKYDGPDMGDKNNNTSIAAPAA